jgi:hypothetical protein
VTISRLRHHGLPGLQAQKEVRIVKTAANAIDIGTFFVNVSPTLMIIARNSCFMVSPRLYEMRFACVRKHASGRGSSLVRMLHARLVA